MAVDKETIIDSLIKQTYPKKEYGCTSFYIILIAINETDKSTLRQ